MAGIPREKAKQSVSTPASEAEAKCIQDVLNVVQLGTPNEAEQNAISEDIFDKIIAKYPLRKTLRIQARVCRWKAKSKGPITAMQVQCELNWWIKKVQQRAQRDNKQEAKKII